MSRSYQKHSFDCCYTQSAHTSGRSIKSIAHGRERMRIRNLLASNIDYDELLLPTQDEILNKYLSNKDGVGYDSYKDALLDEAKGEEYYKYLYNHWGIEGWKRRRRK